MPESSISIARQPLSRQDPDRGANARRRRDRAAGRVLCEKFWERNAVANNFMNNRNDRMVNGVHVGWNPPGAGLIGMGDRDLHGYSLMRALKRLADRKPLDGLERECSDRRVRGRGRRVRRTASGFPRM